MHREEIITQLLDNRRFMKQGMHGYLQHITKQLPISRAQMELLFSVRQLQPVHSKQLAEHVDLTPGAVSQLLDKLFTEGYVTRTADPHDRRLQSLALTKKGDKLIGGLEKQRRQIMERVISELKTEELAVWLHVQQKMIEQFQKEYPSNQKRRQNEIIR